MLPRNVKNDAKQQKAEDREERKAWREAHPKGWRQDERALEERAKEENWSDAQLSQAISELNAPPTTPTTGGGTEGTTASETPSESGAFNWDEASGQNFESGSGSPVFDAYLETHPDEAQAQAESIAQSRGYDATYWQAPERIAKWYHAIQATPPGTSLPEWMSPELQEYITQTYQYMEWRNGGAPESQWKYLNANDQALPLLAALPTPPPEFLWPEEVGKFGGGTGAGGATGATIEQVMAGEAAWGQVPEDQRVAILHDPQFDIAAFDPMVRQQMLSDPNFNWDGLPAWQKTLFNLQSNPIIGGVVQGMMFGGGSVKGAILGGVVGKAAEVTGYNPNKWFYEQGNGEPGVQLGEVGSTLMGLLNDLGQLMEVGFGYAGQVLDPLLGGRPDVAKELLTDPVQREAALRASRVAYESSPIATFATNVIKGISPMFSEELAVKREALKEQYNKGEITYGEFLKGYGDAWKELAGPTLKPGEQIMMGKAEPVTIMPGVDPNLIWYVAMADARKAIAAEIERGGDPQAMMDSIIQDWSSYAGAPVADLFMQATADPLNVLPFVEGKIQSEIIKSTSGKDVPLFKGGWNEPSKVTAEWMAAVGQMDAAKVGELPAFTRWLAGYNKEGEMTAGALGLFPTETLTHTDPQEGFKGWVQRMMTLAPENRARMAMSMAADHLGALAAHLTPEEFDNLFTSLQKMDLEAAKNIAGEVVGSAEFYTVLPMMRGFDMNALKTSMWDVSAENRGHLLRLADVLGVEPARLVEDLGQPKGAERTFEMLRQKAMQTKDATGKALLEDMDAGRIRVEDLAQIGKTFNGPDALPWHPAQFQAMVLDAFGNHAEKWGVDYFKIQPGSFASQVAKTLKGVQSLILLGYSPKYIIDNVINGEVTMAASGVYGLMSMKQIDAWTKRFGFTPDRMADSGLFGHVGVEGKKGSAIADAMRSKGIMGQVQRAVSNFSQKYTMMPLAGKMEGMQGARAMTVGMKDMWGKMWERGRGFSKMDAGLEGSLRAIDPLLPELVYRAIEGGVSQKEVMDALTVRQAGVRASDLVTGAAEKMGMTRSGALSLLEKAGVMDALDGYLKGADTPEKVDAAFRSVMKRAEDWVAIRKGQELRHKAEHVANAITAEGENRFFEVVLDNFFYRNDMHINHYLTADEVAAMVEAMPDEFQGQKSLAWLDWYEKEQRAWRKTNTDVLTNLKGVMQALGLTHPDGQKLLTLLGEEFDTWGRAYDFRMKQYAEHYEQWKGKFGQDTIETRMLELEQRGKVIDEEFQKAFETERVKEEQIRDLLVEMVRAKYGDAVAETTRKAYQQTIDFRAEMTGVLQKHRKDVKNLYGADRRAANRKFYQDDYLYRVVDMRKVWEDGVGKVQDSLRGADGGPQTVDGGRPHSPQPSPTGRGGVAAEPMAQAMPTVEAPPPAPPQMSTFGEGSKNVWKIASENGLSGLDKDGNQVFGAKLDVIKFVKKWGGAEGGQVKRFDDITPEIMQKAVDAKAAWAKDQMALGLDTAGTPTRPALDVEAAKVESEALPEPSEKAGEVSDQLTEISDQAAESAKYDPRNNPTYQKAVNGHISDLETGAREALQYELSVMRDMVNDGEAGTRLFKDGKFDKAIPSTYPDWYKTLKRAKKDVLFALDALTRGLDKPENGLYRSLKGIAADLLSSDGRVLAEKWEWAKAWGYEGEVFWKLDRAVDNSLQAFYKAAADGDVRAMDIHREALSKTLADYPQDALHAAVKIVDEAGDLVDGPETYNQYHDRLWKEVESLYQQGVVEKLNADAEVNIREAEARGEMAMTREVLREQMIEQGGMTETQADALLELFDANAKTYGPKYGMTPEQFFNRIYGGVTKGGLGELQQTAMEFTVTENKTIGGWEAWSKSGTERLSRASTQEEAIRLANEKLSKPNYTEWWQKEMSEKQIVADEIRDEFKANGLRLQYNQNDATFTLYHGTTENGKTAIMQNGFAEMTFFSHSKNASAFGSEGASSYAKMRATKENPGVVMTMKVDPRDVSFNSGSGEFEAVGGLVLDRSDGIWKSPERVKENPFNLAQENKGAVTMLDDMKGLIHAYEAADFSTFVHEPAHIFLRQLMNFEQALPEHQKSIAKDWKAVQDWVRVERTENGEWRAVNGEGKHSIRYQDDLYYYRGSSGEEYVFATMEEAQARLTDEMFARGLEKYILEGSAPTKALARVFELAKQWMMEIYRAITGSPVEINLTPDIRKVFDRLFADEPLERFSTDEKARRKAVEEITGQDFFAGLKEKAAQMKAQREELLAQQKARTPEEIKADAERMARMDAEAQEAARKALAEEGKAAEGETLKVKIDEELRKREAAEIMESDSFKALKEQAARIREARKAEGGTQKAEGGETFFQKKAALPLGGMDEASGFIPEGAILDEAYTGQIKPLLEAMQAEARSSFDYAYGSAQDGGGTTPFDKLTPELQAQLMAYAKKVTKQEMPAAKLASVRYGEGMRDWALLNYNKKYGFDKAIENVVPYQFWATRTGMNSALRIFDRPAWFANYFRMQRFASRYERDLPDRLKGKIRIELPFLPEWTGRALYVDPYKQLFPWVQYAQPLEQMRRDKNAQVFEAERVLQEWAADGSYSEEDIQQAAQSRAGSVWEAAIAEAAVRRKAEISNPLDFMSVLLGPAWYLTMPAKALGFGEGAESIGLTTMTRTGIAMETATKGTWAEPIGKLVGLLAKPEQWIREKKGLPQFGEYGEYYIDRQLANLVAEGAVTVDEAKQAMIERSGEAYEMATERVRTEIMLRTPTAMSVYAGTHGGLDDLLASLPASVLGGGILPEGELRYRGLKEKWNAAWDAYDKGDTEAIGTFFEDHPEYEVYLMKGQTPEERLRNMLVSQIWDGYMGLDKATRRVVLAQLGAQFEHAFLNSETRSPESLSLETLSRWSMMLGHKPPTPPSSGQGAVNVETPKDVPQLEGLPTGARNALGEYEAAKAEMFPQISELQNLYFSSSDADKKRILSIYPQLREYWDWRRQYITEHPEAAPFLDKNVAQGIISGELNAADYGMTQAQAERLIGYYNHEFDTPMYTADYYLQGATPFTLEALSAHQLMGAELTEGAYKELRLIWEGYGKPGSSFDDWLENTIYATYGW